jgi:hypothetical protein
VCGHAREGDAVADDRPDGARSWRIVLTNHAFQRIDQRLLRSLFGASSVARAWLKEVAANAIVADALSPCAPAWVEGRNLPLPERSHRWVATARGRTPVTVLLADVDHERRQATVVTVIVHDPEVE